MSHDTTVTSPFHSSSFKVSNLQKSKMLALKSTWASFSTPGVKHPELLHSAYTEYLLLSLWKINFYYSFYRRYPSMHRQRSSGGGGGKGIRCPHALVLKSTRMNLTIPVTWATSERTFSALRWLKNYLRSTTKQDRLNNCLLVHYHKSITDTLDTVKIAKRIACANEQLKGHFGNYAYGWVEDEPPPPPPLPHVSKRSAASPTVHVGVLANGWLLHN